MSDHATAKPTDRFDLRALYEASRLLSTSDDREAVVRNLLLSTLSKLLVTRGAVLLFDPLAQRFRVADARGPVDLTPGTTLDLPLPPSDHLLHDAEVPDALRAHGLCLVVPLMFRHRLLGLLALGRKATGQPFSKRELEFAQALATLSAAALHNALLIEELQQANRDLDLRLQQLDTLFELSQEFNATIDRDRLAHLLSLALMGQLLINRYLLLVRVEAPDGTASFEVLASRGLPATLPPERAAQLGRLEHPLLLEEASATWDWLRAFHLYLVLPIRQQGVTQAVLGLGRRINGAAYGPGEIEFLYALGTLAASAIRNTFLIEAQIERQHLERELQRARQIQQRLLPQRLPEAPGVQLAACALPSQDVGGDYYDVLYESDGSLRLAIADVAGKGMAAALLMANLQACLHVLLPLESTLEQSTAQINRVICDNTEPDQFITFFQARYTPSTHQLTYVNAGHNPPLLLRASGQVERLSHGGLLLGVLPEARYEAERLSLNAGDLLVLFTDGVTEAMGPHHEPFGEDRLLTCLQAHRHQSAHAIVTAVQQAVEQFTNRPANADDDFTLVILKVLPS
ncbi:PP2C family protein-serine/threonine phosphatase [Rhodothermus profundi]|uniref:Sigma-B regulation protein RsbU (Phosphoserine phosphatase) n=1 Tax=Rhodothermus profundi TaxID=633813 RepID=A0A1M6RRD1_9BACT|nr:SpoIIE family protein phosphatase [Rhodothermus profundi]SHK34960.1 sigma-B regulation protein RsbU (phosphoserine phosphatase) [Rhodothermus profundi]